MGSYTGKYDDITKEVTRSSTAVLRREDNKYLENKENDITD